MIKLFISTGWKRPNSLSYPAPDIITGKFRGRKCLVLTIMLIVTYFPSISSIVMAVIGLEFATFRAVLTVLFNDAHYMGSFLGVLFPVVMAIIFSEFAGTRLAAVLLSQNG